MLLFVTIFILIKGASYIKTMLMENSKLQCLDINGNQISDDGMREITEALQHNDTLTKLNAESCGFSETGTYIHA